MEKIKSRDSVEFDRGVGFDGWLGRIHQGDALALMGALPPGNVGAVVTSPPYNMRVSTGGGFKNPTGGKWKGAALAGGYEDHSDDMPLAQYIAWQRRCLDAMWSLLSDDGAIYYNHKRRVQNGLLERTPDDITAGFPVRQIVVWQRAGGVNFNEGYYLPTHELIYLIAKPRFKLAGKTNALGDVWRIPQESGNPHPAPFPLQLACQCVASTRGPVLDPFMGSGTTALAAISHGRDWIGFEKSAKYVESANERIADFKHQLDV